MGKTLRTRQLEKLLAKKFNNGSEFFVFECTYGFSGNEIVDCVMYNTQEQVTCFEIKQSVADFRSKSKLSFFGHKNYFVMPYEIYKKVRQEIYEKYPGVGVYVPIKTPKYGDKDYEYDIYDQLRCVVQSKKRAMTADRITLLGSMLRSMQRDRMSSLDFHGGEIE